MKTPYSAIILRYVHDVVTGEFANIGVVLYAPAEKFLDCRFTYSYERLNAIFLKIDHQNFRALMRYLSHRFEELGAELREGLKLWPVTNLAELACKVLPPDDSSLQWSEPVAGFTEDPAASLAESYNRYVERYIQGAEQVSRTDEEIAKPFRAKLGKTAEKLKEKTIQAKDYEYPFRFAWKNDIWHLYEPVSFDLVEASSIVEKANKWVGRGTALNDSPEKFKIHFLLGEPRRPEVRKAFEHAQRLLTKIPAQKELVEENRLDEFAREVADEIGAHASRELILREKPPKH